MTSGQMATTDNRFIYEVYLCSHQEWKRIKVVKSVTTESSQTKWPLYLIGLRGIMVNGARVCSSVARELTLLTCLLVTARICDTEKLFFFFATITLCVIIKYTPFSLRTHIAEINAQGFLGVFWEIGEA